MTSHKILATVFMSLAFLIPGVTFSQQNTGVGNYSCPPGSKNTGFTTGQMFQCVDTQTGKPVGYLNAFGFQTLQTSCSGAWNTISNPVVCLTRGLSAWFGGVLIGTFSFFLGVTSQFLDTVIRYTVIAFNMQVYSLAKSSTFNIETAWSFFRDIANIGILGIFTFIAISVIVGKTSFNNKRMVANVLIVALLINFSLLFAKTIITTSSIISCQFYKIMVANSPTCEELRNNPSTQNKTDGIGEHFIRIIGVPSLNDTQGVLARLAEAKDDGFIVLLHSLVSSIFLAFVTLALGIATVMLLVRAVLLLFLVVLGPIAFAAYLLPSWSHWLRSWWEALFQQALLAPVLLALLWVSSGVGQGIAGNNGILGDLVANPQKENNVEATFAYFFIVSMLFASCYLAYKFSSSLSATSWGGLANGLTALPFIGGISGMGAVLRSTRGARAYSRVQELGDQIDKARLDPNATLATKRSLQLQQQRAMAISQKEYNFLNRQGVQKTLSSLGIPKALSGTSAGGGFAGRFENTVKTKGNELKTFAPNSADIEKMLKKAEEPVRAKKEEHETTSKDERERETIERERLSAIHTTNKDALEVAKKTHEESVRGFETLARTVQSRASDDDKRSMPGLIRAIKEGSADTTQKEAFKAIVSRHGNEQEKQQLSEATARISQAHNTLKETQRQHTESQGALSAHLKSMSEKQKTRYEEGEKINLELGKKRSETLATLTKHIEKFNTEIKKGVSGAVASAIADHVGTTALLKNLKKDAGAQLKSNTLAERRIEYRANIASAQSQQPPQQNT